MFKLKKILNKHNNAPEPELHVLSGDSTADTRDLLYCLHNGELTAHIESFDDRIFYVTNKVVGEYDSDRTIECYRVTPDMIFEVKSGSYIVTSDKFAIVKNADNSGFYMINPVDDSAESDGYVVDGSGYETTGKVLVRFHCTQ